MKNEEQSIIKPQMKDTKKTTTSRVYEYLLDKKIQHDCGRSTEEYHSPTSIGMAMGKCYTQASGFINPSLKKLLAEKLIVKNEKRHYKAV
jgi:hypothetical protein